jgi:hypothetical protein
MRCPECGTRLLPGRVEGEVGCEVITLAQARAYARRYEALRRAGELPPIPKLTPEQLRVLEAEMGTFVPVQSAMLQGRAWGCVRCLWLAVDAPTVVLTRRVRRPDGERVTVTLPALPSDGSHGCPSCGAECSRGHVAGTIVFYGDAERRPGRLRRGWLWWRRGVGVRAAAHFCNACGWVGVDSTTLAETEAPPLAHEIMRT